MLGVSGQFRAVTLVYMCGLGCVTAGAFTHSCDQLLVLLLRGAAPGGLQVASASNKPHIIHPYQLPSPSRLPE
jgi:hypothetical protein